MRKFIISILLLALNFTFGQNREMKNNSAYYKEIVSVLANDSLHGRATSTIYEDKSVNFIGKKFKEFKRFKPKFQQFNYSRKDSTTIKTSKNIYCYIDNKAKTTILIGAHYDHLGMGEGISRSYNKKGIHNGADDNASGVALLLGLAKKFKTWENKKYNYLFVSYSAHEIGLFGSAAFSKFAKENFKPIALALNFDMVGRLDNDRKVMNVYGSHTLTNTQSQTMNLVAFDGNLMTNFSDKIYECDLKTFAEDCVPCLTFTTGIHSDYHTIDDDEVFINYNGIIVIESYILKLLKSFFNDN
jgi:Zn-dependent M28 family amino/carboxypeptidase